MKEKTTGRRSSSRVAWEVAGEVGEARDPGLGAGADGSRSPANSPNLNAYAERFVLSIRGECLDRFVPLSERHLRTAVTEYVVH